MPANYAVDTGPGELTWVARGLCHDDPDPDAWHPADETAEGIRTRRAYRACAHCPVAADCLAYAAARPWLTGIWGGATTAQRTRMRRNRRRAA